VVTPGDGPKAPDVPNREALRPEEFRVKAPVEVRFRDVDMMGHVNNAVYLTYFEVARAHYWRALGETEDARIRTFVVARAECDFLSPAHLGDDLACGVRMAAIGRTSFTFEYLLHEKKEGRAVARGRTVQVMYDYQKASPRPIEDAFRKAIAAFEGRPLPGP
jgi:acyl-CoA thioester hydrolase